jgi:hypothetical protein
MVTSDDNAHPFSHSDPQLADPMVSGPGLWLYMGDSRELRHQIKHGVMPRIVTAVHCFREAILDARIQMLTFTDEAEPESLTVRVGDLERGWFMRPDGVAADGPDAGL